MICIIKIFIFVLFCFVSVSILSPFIKQALEPEKSANFVSIMKKIMKKKQLSLFYVTETTAQRRTYAYQEDDFLFEIIPEATTISISVFQLQAPDQKKIIFEATIDREHQQVLEQKLSSLPLETPNKELPIIHAFLQQVARFPWADAPPASSSSIRKIVQLKYRFQTEFKPNLNPTIYQLCEGIIAKIEKISALLDTCEPSLSMETKHRFYQLIDNELIELMSYFSKLTLDEQKKYENKLMESLHMIDHSLAWIEQNQHANTVYDFEKTLLLINKRYQD